jgi:CheY-like chemotaxis protein
MSEAAPGGKTILVVEGDDATREWLAVLLEAEGYTVGAAGDGQAALDYLLTQPQPAVIILDMRLPVWDGWRFLAERDAFPSLRQIPVVMMTGIASVCREQAQAHGCAGFVPNRAVVNELLAEIGWCLTPGEPA